MSARRDRRDYRAIRRAERGIANEASTLIRRNANPWTGQMRVPPKMRDCPVIPAQPRRAVLGQRTPRNRRRCAHGEASCPLLRCALAHQAPADPRVEGQMQAETERGRRRKSPVARVLAEGCVSEARKSYPAKSSCSGLAVNRHFFDTLTEGLRSEVHRFEFTGSGLRR